ncbi:pilus assembly PilX N-terminal domain-containing protein [bacterium]|nr:pilus assembly PilX N-terminal domain-containing protein [bacterium]
MNPVSIHPLKNDRGSTLIGALIVISMLGLFGMAVTEMTVGEKTSSVNEMQTVQAQGVLDAGMQYARIRVDQGYSPVVNNKSFGPGSFTVTANPSTGLVTVTATVGNAKKTGSFTTSFASQCVTLDTSLAQSNGNVLSGIRLIKSCSNAAVIMTRTQMDWDVSCTPDYTQVADPDHANKVLICHCGGNGNACDGNGADNGCNTLSVATSAWENGHRDQHELDYLGACDGEYICLRDTGHRDRAGNTIEGWTVASSTFYSTASHIGTPVNGAAGGDWIDGADTSLTGTGNFNFPAITYHNTLADQASYEISVEFADGSVLYDQFALNNGTSQTPGVTPGVDVNASNQVVVDPYKQVTVQILGTSITYGAGGPTIPITTKLGKVASNGTITYTDLFNGAAVHGGETYVMNTYDTSASYTLKGSGSYSSFSASYDSSVNSPQVKVLMNGDSVPNITPFANQSTIESYLRNYIVNRKVVLNPNQVIFLFEIGMNVTSSPNSSAVDYQDLVALMTVADGDPCATPPVDPGFTIENDHTITIDADHQMKVKVLGTAITYGVGGPTIPVTLSMGKKSGNHMNYTNLFSGNAVVAGNLYTENSDNNGDTYSFKASGKYKQGNKTLFSAAYDNSQDSSQVLTLVNGDSVPSTAAFNSQIRQFLAPYVVNGKITLDANQVILLYEIGNNATRYPNDPATDFQDLVLLVQSKDLTDVNAPAGQGSNYGNNQISIKKK